MNAQKCRDCQYAGDKYSFPQPNKLRETMLTDPSRKQHYCCCGDNPGYKKPVPMDEPNKCNYFEEL